MRDRGRLFIFYPKTSQLPVWDTDVNHCCAIEVTVTEEPNLVKEVTQLHLATEAIKVMDNKCGGIGKKMIAEPMISVRQ